MADGALARLRVVELATLFAGPLAGAMLGQARDYIRLAWWTTLFPGLAIVLTTT